MTQLDMVNSPNHYMVTLKSGTKVECLDLIEALGLNYNMGNVLKYLFRHRTKGKLVEDLGKAKVYLDREVASLA